MFEKIKMVSKEEDESLFMKQEQLISDFCKTNSCDTLIRIALLQTLPPICDYGVAVEILKTYMCNQFDFLIIGAYLNAKHMEINDNTFINNLMKRFDHLNNTQKSIVKYLIALEEYYHTNQLSEKTRILLDDSIELDDGFAAHFYLQYLESKNTKYKDIAKKRINLILDEEAILQLTTDDLICPRFFIEQQILLRCLSNATYNALFMP